MARATNKQISYSCDLIKILLAIPQPFTKADVAREAVLSAPTVYAWLAEMENIGLLRQVGTTTCGGVTVALLSRVPATWGESTQTTEVVVETRKKI